MSSSSSNSTKQIKELQSDLVLEITDTLGALDTSLTDSMTTLNSSLNTTVNDLMDDMTSLNSSIETNLNNLDTAITINLSNILTPEQKFINFMLDINITSSSLDLYITSPENCLAFDNFLNSRHSLLLVMESQTARVAMFNSSIFQKALRNNSNALTYLQEIKTIVSVDNRSSEFHQLTSRDCFILYLTSELIDATNQTRNFRHIDDGITSSTMVGVCNSSNLNYRFVSGLEMYVYDISTYKTRTAHIVYFD